MGGSGEIREKEALSPQEGAHSGMRAGTLYFRVFVLNAFVVAAAAPRWVKKEF